LSRVRESGLRPFAAPSAQRDGRGRAHGSGPGAAWASRGGGLATIRASLSTRTLVAETIDDRLFAVEAQSSFIVIDTFDDGPELVESVSGWRGTQISSALARRVAAATPPIRVHQEVRLQLLRARAAAS
jgi:hypothetical protein